MVSKFQVYEHFRERATVKQLNFDSHFKSYRRGSRILPMDYRILIRVGIFLFFIIGMNSVAHSATRYISPSGSDNNKAGTEKLPWKTFKFTIPQLQPGDTLILKDGTYDNSNSGYPEIDCSGGAKNGTSLNPITIKAEHERQAFLNGDGSQIAFRMENCSYWIIEGLRAKSADKSNSPNDSSVFYVKNSNYLSFKRLLLTHPNRYNNSHLLLLWYSSNILVEESEFYWFHRHGIDLSHTNNSISRRNYFNSRGYADVAGGFTSITTGRGDLGVTIYPGSGNIVENNISENNRGVVDIQATKAAVGNQLLGNISLNDQYGIIMNARGSDDKMPMDTIIENHVSISPMDVGIIARGAKNTQVRNVSLFGGSSGMVADFQEIRPGDGIYSFFSENVLTVDHPSGYGIITKNHNTWSHKHPNGFNNGTNFSPSTNVTKGTALNPDFGTCRVFVPGSSPLKKKGVGGADIGANILYRYESRDDKKGVLTNRPLWNPKTGEFPHGVLVSGVNDIAGSSAFDVHKRLNVNFNGCSLPENYRLTPDDLKVTEVTSG